MSLLPRRTALLVTIALAGAALLPAGSALAAGPVASGGDPPTLTGPANNTKTPLKDVVLTWTSVPGASAYQVEISPNAEWTNNTVTLPRNGTTVATTYDVPISLPHESFYWRVRADVGAQPTNWSSPRQFLREWVAPMTLLRHPASSDTNPTLSWSPVTDASLYLVRYSESPNFEGPDTNSCFTSNTTFTPYTLETQAAEGTNGDCMTSTDLADGTTYYWEVRAYDDSTDAALTTDNPPDPAFECEQSGSECDSPPLTGHFVYHDPTAGVVQSAPSGLTTSWHAGTAAAHRCSTSTACPVTPTLSWNPVAGANYYQVAVYRDPEMTNVYRVYDTQLPSVTPRDDYFDAQAGQAYYWRVWAGTDGTIDSASSTTATFHKASKPVSLTGPANGGHLTRTASTFRWTDFKSTGGQGAVDARNYDLQLATDSHFDHVVSNTTDIDLTQYTDTEATLHDGTYYWRVAPIDESGHVLTWSAARTVTVDTKAPSLTLRGGKHLALNGNLTVTASEPVTGVSSSTVRLTGAGSRATVRGSVHLGSTATRWTFVPRKPLVTGQTYTLSLAPGVADEAGNPAVVTGAGVRTTTVADSSSAPWRYGKGWSRQTASTARGHSYERATSGHKATLAFAGKTVTLYGCKSPSMGSVTISIDGKKVRTVSEKQSYTRCGQEIWHGSVSRDRQHQLTVAVTKRAGSIDEVTTG